jgi:hypothetical protein
LQVLRSRVVISEGSGKVATAQSIVPMQQAVLPFVCTKMAAAYETCVDVQEDICSVRAGTGMEGIEIERHPGTRFVRRKCGWSCFVTCMQPHAGSALEAELLEAATSAFNLTSGPPLRFKASLLLECKCTAYLLVDTATGDDLL